MRILQALPVAAAIAVAGAVPTAAHVPDHCIEHSLKAEHALATYSQELRTLKTLSDRMSATLLTAAATRDMSTALDALSTFFEGQFPVFLEAVRRTNRVAADATEAAGNTVLCAQGLD